MNVLTKCVAAVLVATLLCSAAWLVADDSHWFVVPAGDSVSGASFEQLHEFFQKLREEFLKRNQENNERHRTNQITAEQVAAFEKFRVQFEKTHDEICARTDALPEQTGESKRFVFQRKFYKANRLDYLEQRIPELKRLLDASENDPDLAEARQDVYEMWFRYSLMNAPMPQLNELFEQLLIDLKENESHAVYLCDGYFKRLAELQPENLNEKMNASLAKVLEILEKSQNEHVRSYIPKIEGSVRNWTLPGSEMELKGVLMDETEFDLASLKGKVVYVDFWAVWCGPCIGAMPEMHAKYLGLKDAGLEVVTYSIDEDMDALLAFCDQTKYTWPTISLLKSREKGFRNYYDYYGAGGVPKTMLVGRDGKVIATNIRGFQLDRELNKLFGDEMERMAFDPNTPEEAKLDFFYNRFSGLGITREVSSEMYEAAIAFIESNPDNQNRNMVWLCQGIIHNLQHRELIASHGGQSTLAPEYQSLTVMKRLLPALKDSKNTWVQEYTQTVEAMIRGRELAGKPMELEGILADGSKFDIKEFRGKPVVVCFYKAFQRRPVPAGMVVGSALPFMLEKLKSYDADYGEKVGIVVYLVGKEHQDFPEPDETMKHWKITYGEDSAAEGMKNYWDYYGLRSSPTWFFLDHDGNVVDTKNVRDLDKTLEELMER